MAGGAGEPLDSLLERQLGRRPRGSVAIALTCPWGAPAVIETAPYLEDGTPFPTAFYLTCPFAVDSVSRVEAGGGVRAFRDRVTCDEEFADALARLEAWYQVRRRRAAQPPPGAAYDEGRVLDRGIGGPESAQQASCLHAYVAALLAAAVAHPEAAAEWLELAAGLGAAWCDDARCLPAGPLLTRRAAMDVGTNSVRLLVADRAVGGPEGPPTAVLRRALVTRLGEGVAQSGVLGEEACRRTEAAVARLVREARILGAGAITLVGTSAARTAANGPSFISALGQRYDVRAGVLPAESEAKLAFLGATLDVPGSVVMVDVGGGSTEIVTWGEGEVVVSVSLELGCVRDTERWFSVDPPLPEECGALCRHVERLAGPMAAQFRGADTLVAVGGTATTLAALELGLERYDPKAVHLTSLARDGVLCLAESLCRLDLASRAALPCMQPGRAEVIVAGTLILLRIMDILGQPVAVVSERDLLDGVIIAAD